MGGGGFRKPGLRQQLNELEARKAELCRPKVAELHLALADPAPRTEAAEIIRLLGKRQPLTVWAPGQSLQVNGLA